MIGLGASAYKRRSPLLTYKQTVKIPGLGMVDDFLTANKCGVDTVISNSTTNSFIESKRLNFSEKKCHRLHVGRNKCNLHCAQIKVHDAIMNESESQKYLGDIVSDSGNVDENVDSRCGKGYGIAGDILSILDELPLGTYRIEAGLQMRNGMLIGGMLTNADVWVCLKEKHYLKFEQVDEFLLRGILQAHSKTAKEVLHLDTGTVPLRYVIKNRRLNYLHHIVTRDKNELISRVFFAQVRSPVKNDWAVLVGKDLTEIDFKLSHSAIAKMKKEKFKTIIKRKIRESAFEYLQNIKLSHSKVKHIEYSGLDIAPYIKDTRFTADEKFCLLKLRTSMTLVKNNFRSRYPDVSCQCDGNLPQTQAHLLNCDIISENCPQLRNNTDVVYSDIFSEPDRQLPAVRLYAAVLETLSRKMPIFNE
jgi:hypothetical protein